MKKLIALSAGACLVLMQACTNNPADFWHSNDAFLGQPLPGDTPVKFAPAMLADTAYFAASRVVFSNDGKTLYFCRNKSWKGNDFLSINSYTYDDGNWAGPVKINEHYNSPTLSADGQWLYFGGRGANTWRSRKTDTGWSKPEGFFRPHVTYDFMPTASGNMYAGSVEFAGNDGSSLDVCTMSVKGKDTIFTSLGKPVNVPGWNGDFFVAKDESFLILSSKETKDFNSELYISYRKPDSTWTNPKSLGAAINNGLSHRYGQYVTDDKRFLFYCYGHSEADCAIYWVRFDKLFDSMRHTNFEPYVLDSLKNDTTKAGKAFSIQVPVKAFVDDDGANTLTYSALLGDGSMLPSWMHFDGEKKTISGTAPAAGNYTITITAADSVNAKASSSFVLTVAR